MTILKRPSSVMAGVFLLVWSTTTVFDAGSFNYPMERVAGGTFIMGSPLNEIDRFDEECQHHISVDSFSIGKYEVTQAQWKAIMGKKPTKYQDCDNCPVGYVSWNDIQKFIKTLNRITHNKTKYRLPTEIEWEYAARGGDKSRNFQYAGSDSLGDVAWYYRNSGYKTHPVGKKLPNELGLYDMSGNVFEWCQDTYRPYPCDGKNEIEDSYRFLRGGACSGPPLYCRVAHRGANFPTLRDNNLGFRLAFSSF